MLTVYYFNMEQGGNLDPQAIIDKYGLDATIAFNNGLTTNLGSALELERDFCTAKDDERLDPNKRALYLVRLLANAGSLKSEDESLLPQAD